MSQIINVGTTPNDGTGDKLRNAFIIVNDNFASIETLLSGSDVLTISQITGLQTALDNIQIQLSYIPGIQSDINSINNTIYTINQTLNSQNASIIDLYDQIGNLQDQINQKIEDAPSDGNEYVRKDGAWSIATGGAVTPSLQETIAVNNVSNLGFSITDGAGSQTEIGTNIVSVINPGLNNYSLIQDGFSTMNFNSNNRIDINGDEIKFKYFNGSTSAYSHLKANPSQNSSYEPTFYLPSKTQTTNFTLATTQDYTLQAVTNLNGSTTNNMVVTSGISATGSKSLFLNKDYLYLLSQNEGAMTIAWNRILFPSSNNISTGTQLSATGSAGTKFVLPGFKSGFTDPFILVTRDEVWVPFTGNSNTLNIQKTFPVDGITFSVANYFVRGLTSSNQTISITSTGSNTSTNWAWDAKVNPNLVVDSLQFNTASTTAGAVGRFVWNDIDGTLDLGMKGGNVTLQVGQEQLVRVVNKTATNITLQETNYQAVRVTGAQGQRLKVDLALATSDLLSAETIGLVTETILNNEEGFVTTSGLVRGINTTGSLQGETWVDGDTLYLSPTTAGNITNVKPSAPQHLVIIGYVVYTHSVNGKIFVKVDNGYELDELHNVKITGATAGQVLQFGTSSLWENKTLPTIASQIGYTPFKWVNTTAATHSGTIVETIVVTKLIPAGTFNSTDIMRMIVKYTKPVGTNTMITRVKINTTNTLVGAIGIARLDIGAASTYAKMNREFDLFNGNLLGYNQNSTVAVDTGSVATIGSSTPYNTTNDLYVFFTVQLGASGDQVTYNLQTITN